MELISRRGALQAIARLKSDYDCDYNTIVEKCRDAVKRLPTHGEERKTGKWIAKEGVFHTYNCSLCGRHVVTNNIEKFPYCHCGAKMEVEE